MNNDLSFIKDYARHEKYVALTIERNSRLENLQEEKNRYSQIKKAYKTVKKQHKDRLKQIEAEIAEITNGTAKPM